MGCRASYLYDYFGRYVPPEPGLKQASASSAKDKCNFLTRQVQKTLFQKSVALLATTVVICIIENHNVVQDPLNFSILNMIFETIRYLAHLFVVSSLI